MTSHSRTFTDLFACFRGTVAPDTDWMALLALANQTLTTTALIEVTERCTNQIPDDVRGYVREMFDRNVMRNDRLAAQLSETVAALNSRDITPILLKGAARLASTPQAQWGIKLMSDLDIVVAPHEVDPALEAMFAAGYTLHFQTPPNSNKWYAELKRPSDVGMVDLHQMLPGPAFFYRPAGDILQHCRLVQIGQGSAYVPSATLQALILIIHDEFQDSDYWTGHIDVRHLLDLRDLARSTEGIDWNRLAAMAPNRLARNALETQLVALATLLDVEVPIALRQRLIPRLQFQRRLSQAKFPMLRAVLLPVAMLDYRNYRTGVGRGGGASGSESGGSSGSKRWRLPRKDTLRFLLSRTREDRVGKI
jgi:hypothetical protein